MGHPRIILTVIFVVSNSVVQESQQISWYSFGVDDRLAADEKLSMTRSLAQHHRPESCTLLGVQALNN